MDEELCGSCNGSGEGMYDGTTCRICKGTGVSRDYMDEYDRQCEAADRYNDEMKEREYD